MTQILKLALSKLGTMLVDRRLLAYVLTVVFTLVGIPFAFSGSQLDPQIVDVAAMVITAVVAAVGLPELIKSWGIRPPSGLDYKKLVTEFLIESDLPIIEDIRDLLEESGVDLK